MPRKTTTEGEELIPRRSTRISSQSVPGQEQAKSEVKTEAPAKRSAEDDSEQSSSKKVRYRLPELVANWENVS